MQAGQDDKGSARPDWRLLAAASSGLFGVQIVWGLQNVSTSRIFQTLGADMADLPMLWIAGPISGLLVQPLVGYFSDRTTSRFGRRRPFVLVGALLTTLGMVGLGHASSLAEAVAALWLLTVAVNIAMQPLRAHLADLLPQEQRGTGYALQVAFIGSGAVLASALPWLLGNVFGVGSVAAPRTLPPTIGLSFALGAILLIASVAVSLRAPDRPLDRETAAGLDGRPVSPVALWQPLLFLGGGLALAACAFGLHLRGEIYLLAAIAIASGGFLWRLRSAGVAGKAQVRGGLEIMADIVAMPTAMRALAAVQFFTWFGLFAFWVYAVPAIASRDMLAGTLSYDASADRVGLLFAAFDATALVVAFGLPALIRRLGIARSHLLCLAIGAAGLFLLAALPQAAASWTAAVAFGVAWASILSAPYAIVANSVPEVRLGTYMGIHNIFLVVPQLVAATTLGVAVEQLVQGPLVMLWLAGGCLLVAALLTFRIRP